METATYTKTPVQSRKQLRIRDLRGNNNLGALRTGDAINVTGYWPLRRAMVFEGRLPGDESDGTRYSFLTVSDGRMYRLTTPEKHASIRCGEVHLPKQFTHQEEFGGQSLDYRTRINLLRGAGLA